MCVHGRRRFLPDLPLLSIFDALPLYKLLKTDRVCPRFAQLQAVALANRKMLTIFIGRKVNRNESLYENELFFEPHLDTHTTREAEEEMAEYSALEVQTLNEESINWLKNTFPRVTKLRLIFGRNYELANVNANVIQLLSNLLEPWAEKLETFGIWASNLPDTESSLSPFQIEIQSLFALINDKLPSLQSLTISVPWFEGGFSNLDVSFLGRLKLFSTNIQLQLLLDSLNRHGAILENFPEIRLFGCSHQHQLREMPTRLASKITALSMESLLFKPAEAIEQLKTFFGRCSALKYYKLSKCSGKYSIYYLFNSLLSLSQLTFLELGNIPFFNIEKCHSQQDLQPLSTLETLSINGFIRDRHFLSFLGPLDRLFPALKSIDVHVLMGRTSADFSRYSVNTQLESNARRDASKAVIMDTVTALMLQFSQLQLEGILMVARKYLEKDVPRRMTVNLNYLYLDKFNFTDGIQFEEWQFKDVHVFGGNAPDDPSD